MSRTNAQRLGRRPATPLLWLALLGMAVPASACELDGLSHGYGPMSALFAGAHRYQSLNGLEDEESPPEPPPSEPAKADDERRPSPGTAPPPTPPRSFVAWAKAKPKPAGTPSGPESLPPAWVRVPAQGTSEPSKTTPENAER